MIVIRGFYYDGQRSAQIPARCCFYDNGVIKVEGLDDHGLLASLKSFAIRVSPRLANTPRYLHLPNQGKFETEENDMVDELLRRFGRRSWLSVVHFMETRKRWILICLLAIVLMLWVVGRYGVPFAAKECSLCSESHRRPFAGKSDGNGKPKNHGYTGSIFASSIPIGYSGYGTVKDPFPTDH